MLKKDELRDKNSCLNKAANDEPVFVLRAQDLLAPKVINFWCQLAGSAGTSAEKIAEARRLIQLMEQWHTRKQPD